MEQKRACKTCKKELDISMFGFYVSKGRKNGRYRKECKKCRVIKESERMRNNPALKMRAKLSTRKSQLRNQYGITLEDFEALLVQQDGKCAICKKEIAGPKANVDHCHVSNKVRGLLCWNCNIGLGYFKDNLAFLASAIEYLKGTVSS